MLKLQYFYLKKALRNPKNYNFRISSDLEVKVIVIHQNEGLNYKFISKK